MAITKLPARVQPVFNEVVVTDDTETTLQVSSVAPSPAETITLYHVNANGGADFDLKGFLSKMFYDARVPVVTPNFVPWVFRDQRLVVNYTIGSDITQYLALNGVRQIGESLDVINEVASPVLSDRAKSNPEMIVIPCYDGFPVGFSAVWRNEYSLDTSDAFIVTLDAVINVSYAFPVTGEGMILWGDGQIESAHNTNYRTHTYTEAGIKTISFLPGDTNAVHDPVFNDMSNPALQQYRSRIRTVEQFSTKMSVVRFALCAGLQSVNAVWRATDFEPGSMFRGCTNLSTVPDNFFDSVLATEPKSWDSIFYGCSQLTVIPAGFFSKASNSTSFYSCFYRCSKLTSIPSDLFPANTYIEGNISVEYIFFGCTALTSIPSDLFQPLGAKVSNFGSAFAVNTSLTTIPTALFRYATTATIFAAVFQSCTRLTSIPVDLFRYNVAATTFNTAFNGCSKLTIIPDDLFRYNVEVTSYAFTFQNCVGLTAVPATLFANNPKLTSVNGLFQGNRLTSIPATLFDNNPELTSVASLFQSGGVASIPAGLFAQNPKIIDFTRCFYGTLPIVSGTTPVTAEGYRLWERAGKSGYPATVSGNGCFYGQTRLADYADIPSNWK